MRYAKDVETEKVLVAVKKKERDNAAEAAKANVIAEVVAAVVAGVVAMEKEVSNRKEGSLPSSSSSYLGH